MVPFRQRSSTEIKKEKNNMPKIKTHKATKKRFKITGRGKLRRRKQGSSHLRRRKSKRARREMQQGLEVDPVDVQRIERLLGTRVRKKKRKRDWNLTKWSCPTNQSLLITIRVVIAAFKGQTKKRPRSARKRY